MTEAVITWFLYDNSLRNERVNDINAPPQIIVGLFVIEPEQESDPMIFKNCQWDISETQ